jgi:imidazole glycerol-phosphate synthase subunit HisF
MLARRIIPCLDVKDGVVVKGVQFRNHRVVGEVLDLALRYRDEGADELVFYDITASSDQRVVDKNWIKEISTKIDIPFTVAGGIRTLDDARKILHFGADKISINSPALERPDFISELAESFGSQCVVVGIDSRREGDNLVVYQYTGDEAKTVKSTRETIEWARRAQELGAGEIVLNCMNSDGVKNGYDIDQMAKLRAAVTIPIIASGGAGAIDHFKDLFDKTGADGALAASVFHDKIVHIPELKRELINHGVAIRPALAA